MDSALNVEAQRLSDLSRQVLEAENPRKEAQAVYQSAERLEGPIFDSRGSEVGTHQ